MILLATAPAFSQGQHNYFYGKVVDSQSKKGIPGVNLSIAGTQIGTTTDKTGTFSFFTNKLPATLAVSHIGYETKTIFLDTTSFSLMLYLSRKATVLKEVEITANKHEPFFRDNLYSVLDYEIDSSLVYLLIYRNYLSKAQLICKNIYGDTVATSDPFTFKPRKLFRDCLGNLHVLARDSGYQVFRHEKNMLLIHPVNLKKFEDVLKNCVAANSTTLYFHRVLKRGLGVEYYGIDRNTLVRKNISQVSDEQRLKMLRRNPEDAMLLGSAIQPSSREDFVTWNYVHKILYRPIKTSLYLSGGFICIFNTPDKQVEFYDEAGNFSYKLALKTDLVKEGRWISEIFTDETSSKMYTTYIQNGRCHVYEINLNNGMLKKRLTLFHPYPEKLRFYNDYIYYLFDVSGDPDNKMVYRQKL
jgi:hypothetical protein